MSALTLGYPGDWLGVVDAFLKAALVLMAAGGVAHVLRRASAATRHLVWTVALIAALALPLGAATLPQWHIPVLRMAPAPQSAPSVERAPARAIALAARTDADGSLRPGPTNELNSSGVASRTARSWISIISLMWAGGVTLILLYVVAGHVLVSFAHRARGEEPRWAADARALAAAMGVHSVRFRTSARGTMPMTFGVLRPVVALPAEADSWAEEQRRAVLLHELAHVQRGDCLTHLAAQICCALYWPNPLVWMAARRARIERERACDDAVLAFGTERTDYAAQLLDMAQRLGNRGAGPAGTATLAMAHRSQLEGRLMAILDPSVPRSSVSRRGFWLVAVLSMVALAPLAAVQPWDVEQAPRPAPESRRAPEPRAETPIAQSDTRPRTTRRSAEVVSDSIATTSQVVEVSLDAVADVLESLPEIVEAAVSFEFDDQVRNRTRSETRAAIAEALEEVEVEVRREVRRALEDLRDEDALEPLRDALRRRSDRREERSRERLQVERRSAEALADALKDVMKDVHADVERQVRLALERLGERR